MDYGQRVLAEQMNPLGLFIDVSKEPKEQRMLESETQWCRHAPLNVWRELNAGLRMLTISKGGASAAGPDRVRSPLMQARSAGTSEALVFENKLKHFKVQILFSFAQNV